LLAANATKESRCHDLRPVGLKSVVGFFALLARLVVGGFVLVQKDFMAACRSAVYGLGDYLISTVRRLLGQGKWLLQLDSSKAALGE
jgi:hypothetical protein